MGSTPASLTLLLDVRQAAGEVLLLLGGLQISRMHGVELDVVGGGIERYLLAGIFED